MHITPMVSTKNLKNTKVVKKKNLQKFNEQPCQFMWNAWDLH